jgi:CheY-like chemotaxis protein
MSPAMASTHRTVLLVDDSVDTLEMYAVGLAHAGYRPLTASDTAGALGQLRNEHPDAIVTDLQFDRGQSGWELIDEIRNDPETRQVPVVVLTGRMDTSIVGNAERVGCVAVLRKPCLPQELALVLERVLPDSELPLTPDWNR